MKTRPQDQILKPGELFERSLAVILHGQHASGAYVASPNFPTYDYCWFRDGAFIAYAMDRAGEHASARRFHDWAATAVLRHADRARRAVEKGHAGLPLAAEDVLHTRYTLEGQEAQEEEWPNFQLDGFGTWLWALDQHLRLSGQPAKADWLQAAGLTVEYLAALWSRPCYDCWEEYPDQVHLHTLAAIYGGLASPARLAVQEQDGTLQAIREYVFEHGTYDGYFVKFVGSYTVDASLLGLSTPYRLVTTDDPRIRATVQRIEKSLVHGGGVHRYPTDTYYGGGEWVLLAGWLGWYYAENGETDRASELLAWMAAQADDQGRLPEQVPASLIDPNYLGPWVRRWGPIASPLLWSHAMYLVLRCALAD